MIRISISFLVCAVNFWLQLGLSGQEEAPIVPSYSLVEFDFLVVQVPEATALPIIAQLRSGKQSEQTVKSILSLVSKDKAKLIAWPILATKSGQRAVVEQIEEFRYATEYKPAEKSRMVQRDHVDPGTPEGLPVPVDPQASPPKSREPQKVISIQQEFDAVPNGFETRNLGVSLEIEAIIGPDGTTIDLSLVPQHNWLLEMRRVEIEDKTSGGKVVVEQPQFLTNKVATSIRVKDGDYTLLGTFKTKKPEGFIELFILHTQLKKVN